MSKKTAGSGPGGQCCATCQYVYKTANDGLLCRRYPVENRYEMMMPDQVVVEQQPQMPVPQLIVGHPWTVAQEWCGEYHPIAALVQ